MGPFIVLPTAREKYNGASIGPTSSSVGRCAILGAVGSMVPCTSGRTQGCSPRRPGYTFGSYEGTRADPEEGDSRCSCRILGRFG
jgi:hypothetical protein